MVLETCEGGGGNGMGSKRSCVQTLAGCTPIRRFSCFGNHIVYFNLFYNKKFMQIASLSEASEAYSVVTGRGGFSP